MLGERWRAHFASVVLVIATAIALLLVGAPRARADAGAAETQLAAATDGARASAGVPALAWAGDLASVAERQAQRMATRRSIYHNPNLGTEVSDWEQVGENVGVGQDAGQVHEAFMNSPHHRDNILSAVYTEVGFGTATGDDGRLYVAEVFRLRPTPADAAPIDAPSPEPIPEPTPEPPPAPVIVVPVAAAPVATPVAPPTTLTTTEVHPRLVASFRSLAPVHNHPVSIVVWVAALMAQGVLIANMCTVWKRYRIGSGW